MEKKQAVLLVVLLFGISLVSFFLGIMIGRSGPTPPTATPEVITKPLPVSPKPVEPAKKETSVAAVPAPEKEPLTFYDALPKGEQPPLGSGINLPPEARGTLQPDIPSVTVSAAGSTPAESQRASTPSLPNPAAQGGYVVQVASFKQLPDATGLRDRLEKKGYTAFTQEADLAEKGVWYRVMVGPYAGSEAAGQVAEHLKVEEKLAGIIKKQ
jgi:cell division protein FtsN